MTYEQNSLPQSTLLPSLLASYDSPSKYIIHDFTPTHFDPLPSSWDAIKGGLSIGANLGQNLVNAPVANATRQTELQQQAMAQSYLKNLQATGKGQYVQSIGPNGQVSTGPMPYNTSTAALDTGQNPLQSNSVTPQPQTQTDAPPNAPVARFAPNDPGVYSDITHPALQNTPDAPSKAAVPPIASTPGLNMQSGTISYSQPPPTSPIPVDTSARLAQTSAVPPPANVLDWYKTTVDSRAKSARAEMGPDGTPTGRTIVMHDSKDGIADQPVHPEYMNANLNGWTPKNTTPSQAMPNPVIAGVTAGADSTLAANQLPVAQQVAQAPPQNVSPLLARVMNGNQADANQQNDLASSLAAGTLSPEQVQSAGGPLWASSARGPQAPRPTPSPTPIPQDQIPAGHILMGPPPSAPVAAPEPTPAPAQPSHSPLPPTDPDAVPNTYGVSAQQVLARMQSKGAQVVGLDSPTAEGKQSQIVHFDNGGKPAIAYVDPSGGGLQNIGTVYTKKDGGTPYSEHRYYFDGKETSVNNSIGEAQDTAMMNMVVKNGFATPDLWTSWSRDSKESAYRMAASQENTTASPELNKSLSNRQAIIDSGQRVQEAIEALATPGDRDATSAKNLLASSWNQKLNQFGPIVGLKPNSLLSNAQAAVADFMNTIREKETSRPATDQTKIGAGLKDSEFEAGSIGDLSDSRFSANLDKYLTNQGRLMSRDIDFGLASQYRIPADFVATANAKHFQQNAVGGSFKNPYVAKDLDAYNRLPKGTYIRDEKAGVTVRKGYPGVVQPSK